jgi:Na+-transporting methylmalonyl-CoA/oxaloacetate decarboxylase gamma subunit
MIDTLKNGFTLMIYGVSGVFVVLLVFYISIKLFTGMEIAAKSKSKSKSSGNNNSSDNNRVYSER